MKFVVQLFQLEIYLRSGPLECAFAFWSIFSYFTFGGMFSFAFYLWGDDACNVLYTLVQQCQLH